MMCIGRKYEKIRSFCIFPIASVSDQPTENPINVWNAKAVELPTDGMLYLQDVVRTLGCNKVDGHLFRGILRVIPDILHLNFPDRNTRSKFVELLRSDTENVYVEGGCVGNETIQVLREAWQVDEDEFMDVKEHPTQTGVDLEELLLAMPVIPIMREMRRRFGHLLHTAVTLGVLHYYPPDTELPPDELTAWEERYKDRVEIKSVENIDQEFIAAVHDALDATGKVTPRFPGHPQIWCPSPLLLDTWQKLNFIVT